MRESDAMKWVRQVRDEISSEVLGMSSKKRLEYLKKQSKLAKEVISRHGSTKA